MAVMAIMQATGVGSIMPFISMVTNPEVVHTQKWLKVIYDKGGFEHINQFLFFSGLTVLTILTILTK